MIKTVDNAWQAKCHWGGVLKDRLVQLSVASTDNWTRISLMGDMSGLLMKVQMTDIACANLIFS